MLSRTDRILKIDISTLHKSNVSCSEKNTLRYSAQFERFDCRNSWYRIPIGSCRMLGWRNSDTFRHPTTSDRFLSELLGSDGPISTWACNFSNNCNFVIWHSKWVILDKKNLWEIIMADKSLIYLMDAYEYDANLHSLWSLISLFYFFLPLSLLLKNNI
jgi:hypothetical protein